MFDVIVCGSGLAGSVAAIVFSRQGYRVGLIDRYSPDRYPPEFRAEQVVGVQVEALRYFGLLDSVVGGTREVFHAEAFRSGRLIDRGHESHYGLPYRDIVLGARRAVPESVTRITGRLRDITFSNRQQVVTVEISPDEHRVIQGRLVVLATGLTPLERFGFGRDVIWADHSLSFAFDDQAYTHGSPGIVLLTETICWAWDHGYTEHDHLRGDHPYKLPFANDTRTLYQYVGAGSLRGRCAIALRERASMWARPHALIAKAAYVASDPA